MREHRILGWVAAAAIAVACSGDLDVIGDDAGASGADSEGGSDEAPMSTAGAAKDGAAGAGDTRPGTGGAPLATGGRGTVGEETGGYPMGGSTSETGGTAHTGGDPEPTETECSNGYTDYDETDIDCGGPLCPPCPTAASCVMHADCLSRVCRAQRCLAATCDDAVMNGTESDVDCGGDCMPCDSGKACLLAADCEAAVCTEGICQAATCADAISNGAETDVDCGGTECEGCPLGARCTTAEDCATEACDDGLCVSCSDGVQNGNEGSVDCGGADCPLCALGHSCEYSVDCETGCCGEPWGAGVCYAVHCCDGVQNEDETDIDCGGTECQYRCQDGQLCIVDMDCASDPCTDGVCAS